MSDFIFATSIDHLFTFTLNILVQIALLIGAMTLAARLFVIRPAIRYGILLAAATLVLICPFVVLTLQSTGVGIQ